MKKLADIRTLKNRKLKSNVSFGEYTYGNPTIIDYDGRVKLTVGKFCSIANEVTIILGGSHATTWPTTFPFATKLGFKIKRTKAPKATEKKSFDGETKIGNDVWIGYGTLILSGVTIGDGAIIGAGSVVSKDIEPYSIVAGNPSKIIRYRYPEEVINDLLKKKWWDLPDKKIEEILPLLLQPDIQKLLEVL